MLTTELCFLAEAIIIRLFNQILDHSTEENDFLLKQCDNNYPRDFSTVTDDLGKKTLQHCQDYKDLPARRQSNCSHGSNYFLFA